MDLEPLYLKSELPVGRSGRWVLERFEVQAPAHVATEVPDWARPKPGTFTRLKRGTEVFMTDTYEEWWTQRHAMCEALRRGGDVLITGLGLGLVVESILATKGSPVRSVTVLEKSPDVLALVADTLRRRYPERLRIVQTDAHEWDPGDGHYSVVWHDIWPNPHDPAVRLDIERLERRYSASCDWQASWGPSFVDSA